MLAWRYVWNTALLEKKKQNKKIILKSIFCEHFFMENKQQQEKANSCEKKKKTYNSFGSTQKQKAFWTKYVIIFLLWKLLCCHSIDNNSKWHFITFAERKRKKKVEQKTNGQNKVFFTRIMQSIPVSINTQILSHQKKTMLWQLQTKTKKRNIKKQ